MTDTAHHSIGEVLSLLKEEHADVTISKIRFLESQGLIDPERTPSGYRKFYDADIDRLRWILSQQRDNFLPLKVIKRRLAEEGFDPAAELDDRPSNGPLPEPSLFAGRDDDADSPASAPETPPTDLVVDDDDDAVVDLTEPTVVPDPDPEPVVADAAPTREPEPVPVPAPSASVGSVSMTAGDLAEATGADLGFVAELERMGIIATVSSDTGVYDHEALLATRAAVAFRDAGMEVRHLRTYKVAADREAGLFEQLRGAQLRRGGSAAADARAEIADLIAHGDAIRRSILRRELGLDD